MKKLYLTTLVLASLAASGMASAGKNLPNGKPFQLLQSQIDANTASINELYETTTQLSSEIALINEQIVLIDQNIANLEGAVAVHMSAIAALDGQVDQLESNLWSTQRDVDALRFELQQISVRHDADIAFLESQLESQQAALEQLRSDVNVALAALNSQLATIQQEVTANSSDISGLLVESTAMTANILSMMASIYNNEARIEVLEASLGSYDAELAAISARISDLELQVAGLDTRTTPQVSGHTEFSGVLTNVAADSLSGWAECHSETFGTSGTSISQVQADCGKAKLMLACRQTGSDTLLVAAYADRSDVLFNVGTDRTATHEANGVNWYFSPSLSWGFAPAGDAVYRSSCDTEGSAWRAGSNGDKRVCNHTSSGNLTGGWRCGTHVSLNSSSSFERVFFHAD